MKKIYIKPSTLDVKIDTVNIMTTSEFEKGGSTNQNLSRRHSLWDEEEDWDEEEY